MPWACTPPKPFTVIVPVGRASCERFWHSRRSPLLRQRCSVPNHHRAVPGGDGQAMAVRAEEYFADSFVVVLQGEEFLAGFGIPHPYAIVLPGTTGQALAVWTEGHTPEPPTVPFEGEEFLARLGIPHLRRLVVRGAGQALAVRAEGDAIDPVGVPLEGEEFLAGLGIQYFHVAATYTDEAFTVGAEHDHGTPFEGKHLFTSLGIPHLHHLHRFVAINASQAFPIRAEDQAVDTRREVLESEQFLTRLRVPHHHVTRIRITKRVAP